MEGLGTLELAWAQGYDGSRAEFITKDVICFKCGNIIKFINEDGSESVCSSPGDGVGPLAVHGLNRVFAFADQGVEAKIYVFSYPSFGKVSELTGGAKLEYINLQFSSSEYLASISGVPDFNLTLWRYTDGTTLCTQELSHVAPTCMSFNPANWRQFCLSTEKEFSVWNIEQSDNQYIMQKQKVRLPAVDGGPEEEEVDRLPTRASTRMTRVTRMTVDLPMSSIAGVKGDQAEIFEEYTDVRERARPMSHVWTPAGDLMVGCAAGQLLKVDGETYRARIIYNPGPYAGASLALDNDNSNVTKAVETDAQSATSTDFNLLMGEGSVNCMCLNKDGLFAAGEDGILRHMEVTPQDKLRIKNTYQIGTPIASLGFNPPHHKLALGSNRGSLHVFDVTTPNCMKQMFDIHHGNFASIDALCPGNEHSVSVREDGELQVWQMETGKLVSSMPIGLQACSMSASPLAHIVAVGSGSGHIYFVDLNKLDQPRVIHRCRIHQGPVKHLRFNMNGHFLLTGSDDGHLFVLDGRPSKKFEPLGHVLIPGDIKAMSMYFEEKDQFTKVVVTSSMNTNQNAPSNKLTYFDLPPDLAQDVQKKYGSLKCDFADSEVNRMCFNFLSPVNGICLTEDDVAYALSHSTKQMVKINIPENPPLKEDGPDSYLATTGEYTGHMLSGGNIHLSPHQKWMASCGMDGKITVRPIGALDRVVEVNAHDYRAGGVGLVSFSFDSSRIFSTGPDGVLTCYKWNFSSSGAAKGKQALDYARSLRSSLLSEQKAQDEATMDMPEWYPPTNIPSRPGSGVEKAEQEASEKEAQPAAEDPDAIYSTPTPTPAADATWLEVKELEAIKEEDKEYSSLKKDLRLEIRDMRKQLQAMMKENEEVPDIERLDPHEFDLDMEEQARLQAEGEAEVQRIREDKEFDNLAKAYLTDLIKKECWDNMVVKGRGIQAFNSNLETHNYPMRPRTEEELKRLERAKEQRKVEIEELIARKEHADITQKSNAAAEEEGEDGEGGDKEMPATTGSLGAAYGGDSELLYSQFELHSREQKITQITLLEDAIYRIRMAFNKEFDEVYEKKEQDINKIKERNKRIRKILEDLDTSEPVEDPEMGIIEKPEKLLEVEDSEVKVDKYLTPEQRRKLEEEEKRSEERKLREAGDNWRDRGLNTMMGGVLEIKKEDELKKDIPMPAFMSAKSDAEWSEDEKKSAQEYERKVKELEEERDKYRKQLEMELKKLQLQISDGKQLFDEALQQLFNRKIKTEMVIYQEELKILRLRYSLLLEEELNNREDELTDLLDFKRELKQLSGQAVNESRKNVDAFREAYDILVAEDKVMDKAFKREFHDVAGILVDQLYKLFRRRPRVECPVRGNRHRGQKIRASTETPVYEPGSGNPFAERPSTARQNELARAALETALVDLDKETNMPDGVDAHTWERVCSYRRQKIESEQLVKQKALVLADMQAFLQKRQEEDDSLRNEIEDLVSSLNRLSEDRMRFTCNLEVQLLLKQGQVEVDAGPFIHDYRDSILIHRSVVEDLNTNIRNLGESKIASMVESKDFRKSIVQLEWEHKKMTMEMEDLQNKMRDIQNLKVTREIQAFLNEEDPDGKKAVEIATLEQTLIMQKQHHERNVAEKRKTLKEFKKIIKDKAEDNSNLSTELAGLNVSVNERRHIHEVNADKRSDAGREKQYKEIVQRRKLVELAKAQAQEVAVLRAEVERLRMRTFPALVQVEH